MEIPGKKIASQIEKVLKKEVTRLKKKNKLRLTVFLAGEAAEQLSFVKIKSKVAKKLGVGFEFIHYNKTPSFEEFLHQIKQKSLDPKTTGIVIQQPLPAQLSTESIYDHIAANKEIEGHRKKSPFLPPIGLAVLTLLKFIFAPEKNSQNIIVDLKKDRRFFKQIFRSKKVVLIGRGLTAGTPIGKALNDAKINYIGIDSQTPEPQNYLREADVIITAVGKKIIDPSVLKPEVILINAGLRREKGKLRGDYDEKEIKNIAAYYTPTLGGLGPVDVAYLYNNLVEAAKLQ